MLWLKRRCRPRSTFAVAVAVNLHVAVAVAVNLHVAVAVAVNLHVYVYVYVHVRAKDKPREGITPPSPSAVQRYLAADPAPGSSWRRGAALVNPAGQARSPTDQMHRGQVPHSAGVHPYLHCVQGAAFRGAHLFGTFISRASPWQYIA
jgi:hypothetical protein